MEAQPTQHLISNIAEKWTEKLFAPVDNAPLIVFRVIFGCLLALEGGGAIATGWVKSVFVEPSFTFTFIGFEWLQPLLGPEMYAVYGILALCGIMVMLGFYYRISITLYALLWTMCYLMQKSSYNNHYYLMMLLCWVMVFMPAHRYFSMDVRQKRVQQALTCPRWCLLFFVVQVMIVYSFAALAKLYPDWLELRPIGLWFGSKLHYPMIGPWLQKKWIQGIIAYGGIAFDLMIAPLMLWGRSRQYAFGISVFFHLFNSVVFGIGVFPYMMIGLSVFFFPPGQIQKVFFKRKPKAPPDTSVQGPKIKWEMFLLGIYFLFQLFLPVRNLFIQGDVFWTEEGHRMAWRMMLRSKSGSIQFKVKDKTSGDMWDVDLYEYLTDKQARKLAVQPDMIWQFAQYLKQNYAQEGIGDIEVYANSQVSLNGNKSQPLIDPEVDLAHEPWNTFTHARWILPNE